MEHVGTTSSLFADGKDGTNQRFHQAVDFPIRVALPGLEPDALWR